MPIAMFQHDHLNGILRVIKICTDQMGLFWRVYKKYHVSTKI